MTSLDVHAEGILPFFFFRQPANYLDRVILDAKLAQRSLTLMPIERSSKLILNDGILKPILVDVSFQDLELI